MIDITIQEKRQYFQNFTCEVLTSKEENKVVKDFFEFKKNENSLGTYFKDHAWNDDLEGETRIYLVKDLKNRTALFFSLKCGLLFKKNSYDKLEEDEREFVDMLIDAKQRNDQEAIEAYYEYGSSEFQNIDVLFDVADKRIDIKNETRELGDGDSSLKVDSCYSAIELQHLCRNELYIPDQNLQIPLGFGIFWEIIVPEILSITQKIGCKYLYLFAADHSENSDIKKLVYYYKNAFKFYECDEDEITIVKPEYDRHCYGLVQEISKLRLNQEAIWQEYSDVG